MASEEGPLFPTEFNNLWDSLPGVGWFSEPEAEHAQVLFDLGFTHHSNEPGYNADTVHWAREEFWEYTGIDPADFDWHEWRVAMGYE